MKRLRNDNRGAALVTAVITIMFIAILGTTLLSVSYSNLIMKKNNARAQDNTYTAEMAMGELQSVLRSKDDLNGVMTLLNDTTKVNKTTKTFSASAFYPMAYSEANSSDDQVIVTYDSIDDSIPNTIIFRGVTASSVVDGFESNVKTDITITATSGGRYNLDINDFSILCDQDFSMDDATQMRATNSHVYGYLYCGKKSNSDSTAMKLISNSTLNIISEAAIINGDLVIQDNAVLHILGGTCIITGNVKLSGNATLIVSSECKISGTISRTGSNTRVLGSGNITTGTGISVDSALEGGTVTQGLYRDFSIWGKNGSGQYQNLNVGKNLYREDCKVSKTTTIGGQTYTAFMFYHKLDSGQTFNGFTNTLFISNARIKVQSGNYFNSTVITPGRVLMAVQKQYVTTHMDPEVYQQLRQLSIPSIKLQDATEITNPKKYVPGTSYASSPDLKYDDILYPRETTSNFLSNLFNVANPGGGSKKTTVKVSNWRINEYD